MCGIYGSNDLTTFEVLGDANRERGNFSTGILYKYRNSSYQVLRRDGTPRWSSFNLPNNATVAGEKVYGDYLYLGHNQAPTSSKREYDELTTHPFQYGDWIVAHNGVLTNTTDLILDMKLIFHFYSIELVHFSYQHTPSIPVHSK